MTNQLVKTPLGKGIEQGRFVILDGHNDLAAVGVLVRLPINDLTRPEMNKSNCMTPHAQSSGLWVFQGSEIK
jgi:hypothetical protein